MEHSAPWPSRLTAVQYGIGSALTLDEFALWLNLEDVYWATEGRKSIDAIVLFGALLSVGLWGGPFLRALGREVSRPFKRRPATQTGRAACGEQAIPIRDERPGSAR